MSERAQAPERRWRWKDRERLCWETDRTHVTNDAATQTRWAGSDIRSVGFSGRIHDTSTRPRTLFSISQRTVAASRRARLSMVNRGRIIRLVLSLRWCVSRARIITGCPSLNASSELWIFPRPSWDNTLSFFNIEAFVVRIVKRN
jgi:hypothetical protein